MNVLDRLLGRRIAAAEQRHTDTVTLSLGEYQRLRDDIAGARDQLALAQMQAEASYRDKRTAELAEQSTAASNRVLRGRVAELEKTVQAVCADNGRLRAARDAANPDLAKEPTR